MTEKVETLTLQIQIIVSAIQFIGKDVNRDLKKETIPYYQIQHLFINKIHEITT